MSQSIRSATLADVPVILDFIRQLARYEKLEHEVVATEENLRETLFGNRAYAEVVLAYAGSKAVGFALFFHNYSTFLGRPGIYLEDLFVVPEHRGERHGLGLLRHVAKLAVQRRCGRLEWSVLDWNTPAIDFYLRQGAVAKSEWTMHQLAGAALETFAAQNS